VEVVTANKTIAFVVGTDDPGVIDGLRGLLRDGEEIVWWDAAQDDGTGRSNGTQPGDQVIISFSKFELFTKNCVVFRRTFPRALRKNTSCLACSGPNFSRAICFTICLGISPLAWVDVFASGEDCARTEARRRPLRPLALQSRHCLIRQHLRLDSRPHAGQIRLCFPSLIVFLHHRGALP